MALLGGTPNFWGSAGAGTRRRITPYFSPPSEPETPEWGTVPGAANPGAMADQPPPQFGTSGWGQAPGASGPSTWFDPGYAPQPEPHTPPSFITDAGQKVGDTLTGKTFLRDAAGKVVGGWKDATNPPPPPRSPQQQPAPQPARTPQTTDYNKPSLFETWFKDNQGRYSEPTYGEQYWQGIQGDVMGGKVAPQHSRNAYGEAQGHLTGGPQGAHGAYEGSRQLQTPGTGEQYIGSKIGYFDDPGAGERFAGEHANYFATPGSGERYVEGLDYSTPGAAEGNYGDVTRGLAGINYGDRAISSMQGPNGLTSSTRDFNRGMGSFMGASPIGDEYGYFSDGLRNKSHSENLYESGNQGLNTFYDRAADKATERLNREMEARGLYGSGAAIRAIEESNADFGANQARDMAALAGQADDARLGRTSAALDFTKGIDASSIARRELGLKSSMATDEQQRENAKTGLEAYKFGSDEARDKLRVGTEAADSAQNRQLQRMKDGGDLKLAGDAQGLERMKAGTDVAFRGQEAGEKRVLDGAGLAKDAQGMFEDRTKAAIDAGLAGDEGLLSWAEKIFGMGKDMDDTELDFDKQNLDRLKFGADVTSDLDTTKLNYLNSEGQGATTASEAERNRYLDEYDQTLGLSKAKADIDTEASNLANNEKFQAVLADIELELGKGAIDSAKAQDIANQFGTTVAAVLKAVELRNQK